MNIDVRVRVRVKLVMECYVYQQVKDTGGCHATSHQVVNYYCFRGHLIASVLTTIYKHSVSQLYTLFTYSCTTTLS